MILEFTIWFVSFSLLIAWLAFACHLLVVACPHDSRLSSIAMANGLQFETVRTMAGLAGQADMAGARRQLNEDYRRLRALFAAGPKPDADQAIERMLVSAAFRTLQPLATIQNTLKTAGCVSTIVLMSHLLACLASSLDGHTSASLEAPKSGE